MSSPFDKLPAELYDKVFHPMHLLSSCRYSHPYKVFEYIALPYWEIPDRKPTRPGSDDVHSFDHVINVHRSPFGHYIHTRPRPGDLQLRLVNHACNCAMLRVYFKYEGLSFNAGRWHALERFKEHILRNDGKAWSIASAVEKLNVSLSTGEYAVGSIFYKEHSKSRRWKKQLNENEKFDEDAERLKSFLDAGVLAQAVRKMPKLESLIVHLPEEWRDGYPSDYDEVDDEGNTCGEQLRLDLLRSVREAVAAIFEPQAALTASPTIDSGTGHLACLTYLRLTLPCAYDFARVASCMPDTVASRLRHLYMEIVDGTGKGGDLYYTRSW